MVLRRDILQGLASMSLSAWAAQALSDDSKPVIPGVRKIKGDVLVNGAPAQKGQPVVEGDTISTGPRSEVIYVMGGNAYLMRDNTQVHYTADALIGVMRLITGKVLSVFGPGAKRIETPTATLGIRGTGCYLEAQDQRVYFCLCYGGADIAPLADAKQSRAITTQYHDSPFYIGTDTTQALIQPAPVINHRDYELTLLENAVGRLPPFVGSGQAGYS